MLNLKSFVAASAAITLVSGVSVEVVRRNEEPAQPSCTDFTPFVYAGCFTDPSNPERALLYDSGLNTQNSKQCIPWPATPCWPLTIVTVEICVAFCKGNDYKYAGLEYYGECFCGASVNGPQIAESNCNFPCTGNSKEVCGGNDIISIYQDTTFPTVSDSTISDYKPMGCYSEGSPVDPWPGDRTKFLQPAWLSRAVYPLARPVDTHLPVSSLAKNATAVSFWATEPRLCQQARAPLLAQVTVLRLVAVALPWICMLPRIWSLQSLATLPLHLRHQPPRYLHPRPHLHHRRPQRPPPKLLPLFAHQRSRFHQPRLASTSAENGVPALFHHSLTPAPALKL